MDTRDLWEDHVNGLTERCRELGERADHFEDRVRYLEEVMVTLIVALKNGGVIVDDEEGDYQV
jgi:hypothetical protein